MILDLILLDTAGTINTIDGMLDELLDTLVGESAQFIGTSQALGGLGSLMYIFYRVWGHLSRNEEIDIFPLFRPLALATCILLYSVISGSIVSITHKLDKATASTLASKRVDVATLDLKKAVALDTLEERRKRLAKPISFMDEPEAYLAAMIGDATADYSSRVIDKVISFVSRWIFNAAALIIKFLQTFFLAMMLIMGPLTFGLACFEWFYSGLAAWLTRVIHLMLWLPITNLLAGLLETIHIIALKQDIAQINNTPASTLDFSDVGISVFYILGTVGYFMVPTAASYVVESTGAGQAVAQMRAGGSTMGALGGSAKGAVLGTISGGMKAASMMAGGGGGQSNGQNTPSQSKV